MNEKVFQKELAEAFRNAGCWIAKWPDMPVSSMQVRGDGKLRFAAPKPFDLVGLLPDGKFLAIECKLLRSRSWRVDERTARQLETLRDIANRGGLAYLALNWRYESKRPPERVNRAFLIQVPMSVSWLAANWSVGKLWFPDAAAATAGSQELQRVAGGWGWDREKGGPSWR